MGRVVRIRLAAVAAVLAAGAVLVVTAGIGPGGGPRPTEFETGAMRFLPTAAPASRASGAGPATLAFVSPRVGFAATTGGYRFVGRIGPVAASDRGRIERTDDGGESWRTLWSAPRVVFDSIAVSGQTIAATGHRLARNRTTRTRRFVLANTDGGRTWRRLPAPPVGGTIEVLTPKVWVVARPLDVNTYPVRRAAAFRSLDAGRHWRRIALPQDTLRMRFVAPWLGFASARGHECPRLTQLWRTSDGGETWRAVRGTCGPPLTDLDVVSKQLLFAAHADDDYPGPARSVVRRSTDAGRSWRVLWRERGRQVVRLAFADAQNGLVLDELYHPGAGGGMYCPRLRATADAGRTRSPRPIAYSNRECNHGGSGGGPRLPSAFLGTRYAWAGDDGAGVVWRTEDGARTWRVSAQPRSLGLMELTGRDLAGAGGALAVQTAAGPVSTGDGGKTWKPSGWPSDRAIALGERRGAYLAQGRNPDRPIPMITPDGGKTWRRLRPPRGLRGPVIDVAFTSARDGLIAAGEFPQPRIGVFATYDAGRTWRRIPLPVGVGEATGARLGPGVVVITRHKDRPRITTDEGRTWREFNFPADDCETVSRPSEADIWVRCVTWVRPRVALVTSRDGGRTWKLRTARVYLPGFVAVGGGEAWAMSAPYHQEEFRAGIPKKLWRTTDGGATWHQVWVSLGPNARAVQVTTG